MPAPTVPNLRAARAAVFAVFGLNGFMLAMWVVHIPAISDRTGVSKAALGGLILLLAGGALAGMQVAGPLADRFGSRAMTTAAALVLSVVVLGPGFADSAAQLGVALVVFGSANGALDVSMNTQAVHVERDYGRPIMSAFHALFSCGGLVGSLFGAATLRWSWDVRTTLGCATVLGLVIVAVCAPRLLGHAGREHSEGGVGGRGKWRMVLALGTIAFALLLAEGVATDWSVLQVREHLDTTEATAALAFGAFSVMMTLGRFTADRVAAAVGPVAVVRYGTLLGACGLAVVVASTSVPLTLFGWALLGLGLSGGIPQIFTAAGNLSGGSPGVNMSRVFGMGYLGLLAGPAIIGGLTTLMPLTVALVVPLAALLVTAACAGVVARA